MRRLISPSAMRVSELNYFETSGVPSIQVMERAAAALAQAVMEDVPEGARIYLACGTGGNGGDGTACARMLAETRRVTIVAPDAPATPDAVENMARARDMGIPIVSDAPADAPDAWVDALFGTGLSRAPHGAAAQLIARINADRARGAKVFSADIPSGLNGATGHAYDACVTADRTVTFQYEKTGLRLADGLDRCGRVTVADVGFPEEGFGPFDAQLMEAGDVARLLPQRRRNIHKGDCGRLLIVAGSYGMAGAAVLCAGGAVRTGAGLVTVACPGSIVPIVQASVPQATCIPLDEHDGAISDAAVGKVEEALKGKDAAAIGPGLTRRASRGVLRAVLRAEIPAVVDADALNLIAEERGLTYLLRDRHVLTPHPGEAARLPACPHAQGEGAPVDLGDPIAAARALTALGATVLLKGAATVIAGPGETYVSASGCCGMARGGSGDILTGMLGALLADRSGRTPALDAALASELHGLAGERAQAKYGSRGMNARDIIEYLPEVLPR